MRTLLLAWLTLSLLAGPGLTLTVTEKEAREAGQRLWQNECSGRIDGLTSWNEGEDFASLGIGHFIWYPEGRRGPFEESFPKLIAYLKSQKVTLPDWLDRASACPWSSRSAFLADFQGPRLRSLRKLLAGSVAQQARFAALRLEAALPLMLQAIPEEQRAAIRGRFQRVASAAGGIYCLLDYCNFKGEGVNPSERYQGQGWGLLQVLTAMSGEVSGREATRSFSQAADRVLTQRVQNSPPERNEARWLSGWRARVRTYVDN